MPVDKVKEHDRVKRELAQAQGITLIVVPAWWDGTVDRFLLTHTNATHHPASLASTIKKARPELLSAMPSGEPIAPDMPIDFLARQTTFIEGIGEPVTACFFTLSTVNPENWYPFQGPCQTHLTIAILIQLQVDVREI